jgi:hypothetical protein
MMESKKAVELVVLMVAMLVAKKERKTAGKLAALLAEN